MSKQVISGKVGCKYLEINGKGVHVPMKEIENLMKSLDLTEEQAIETWLDDNDYTTNEQVEELTKKAKENGTNKPKADKKPRAKREVAPKENPLKSGIISEIAQFLAQNPAINNIKIENPTKIITFESENKHFKLDLVQKREPKAKN